VRNLEPYMPVIGPVTGVVVTLFLTRKKQSNRDLQSNFSEIFEPAFNELLLIHRDYIDMFRKTSRFLPDSKGEDERRGVVV
jgi:hypothetical protein